MQEDKKDLKNIWLIVFKVFLAVYACIVLGHAFVYSEKNAEYVTVPLLYRRAAMLKQIPDAARRDSMCIPLSAFCRSLDQQIPAAAKVYMPDMRGRDNGLKLGYYFFMSYYLFPRDIGVSVGEQPVYEGHWEGGRDPESDREMAAAGYDLVVHFKDDGQVETRGIRPIAQGAGNVPQHGPDDAMFAFIVPLLCIVPGMLLIRVLFKGLYQGMPPGERAACGFAVGLMLVSQLNVGMRLLGLRVEKGLFYLLIIMLVVQAGLWLRKNGNNFARIITPKKVLKPAYLLLIPFAALFYLLFQLAGLEGLLEFDAVGAWAFKAKIMHLFAGGDIIRWFSEPRLAFAHLDYPTLVPSLHTLTYGVLGHVNEFVTKFWPVWMMFFLAAGVLSLCGFPDRNVVVPVAITLCIAFMLWNLRYMRMEGGAFPIFFFTCLGSLQVLLSIMERDNDRLALGFLVLFGAVMSKYEGVIIMGAWGILMLAGRDTRKMLFHNRAVWVTAGACLLVALPYLWLRLQIPSLHPDSKNFALLLKSPLKIFPILRHTFPVLWARQFFSDNLPAVQNAGAANTFWGGRWEGVRSLYDTASVGFAWMCLVLSILALVINRKLLRPVLILAGVVVVYSAVISILISTFGHLDIQKAVNSTNDATGGRYMTPLFTAWGTAVCLLICRFSGAGTRSDSDERTVG